MHVSLHNAEEFLLLCARICLPALIVSMPGSSPARFTHRYATLVVQLARCAGAAACRRFSLQRCTAAFFTAPACWSLYGNDDPSRFYADPARSAAIYCCG
jgi:hypothetical protein